MLADERLELGDDVGGVPELDVRRDPLLDGDEAKLVEPADLGLRPVLERELGERRAAPEVERLRGAARVARPAARSARPEQPLEAPRVDLVARHGEHVARRRVTRTSGPSAFRSATTAFCSDAVAVFGGSAP